MKASLSNSNITINTYPYLTLMLLKDGTKILLKNFIVSIKVKEQEKNYKHIILEVYQSTKQFVFYLLFIKLFFQSFLFYYNHRYKLIVRLVGINV